MQFNFLFAHMQDLWALDMFCGWGGIAKSFSALSEVRRENSSIPWIHLGDSWSVYQLFRSRMIKNYLKFLAYV